MGGSIFVQSLRCPCVPGEHRSSWLPGHPRFSAVSLQLPPCVQPLVCAVISPLPPERCPSGRVWRVGLRLGSSAGVVGDGAGDQCRRTGMEPACLAVASQPLSLGADPARAAGKPVAVSDRC